MHIGLIGGIGVAATVTYYQRLTSAIQSAGEDLRLTIVHGDVHSLIRNNLADDRQTQAKIFAKLIDQLKGVGADVAAITSLGAHFCFEETKALSSLPLVSAVEPLDDFFADEGLSTVGILGTRVVMRTGFYGQLSKTRAIAIDDEIDLLGQTYQDMAVAGVCTDAQRSMMINAGHRLVHDHGANAVVLGGTDLNLAFDGRDVGYRVIDALDVHVAALAKLAAE